MLPPRGLRDRVTAFQKLQKPDSDAYCSRLLHNARIVHTGHWGEGGEMTAVPDVPPGVDPARPTPVRLYDYFLGGSYSFPADRAAAERLKAAVPDLVDAMWANRGFHGRAALWLAEHGIRQFIDFGPGLPAQNNTYQTVHKVTPDARVVYVDSDPMVAAHCGSLLTGGDATALVAADWRDPDVLLRDPAVRRLIDLGEPVGVLMTTLVTFTADGADPWGLVARYMATVGPGSYLALSHGTYDRLPPNTLRAGRQAWAGVVGRVHLRSKAEVERFFDGLELVPPYPGADPGLTYAGLWGAEDVEAADTEGSRGIYCGVARRP
jgi:S-adenosyl methyltransferase